jgi:hypothetical protein
LLLTRQALTFAVEAGMAVTGLRALHRTTTDVIDDVVGLTVAVVVFNGSAISAGWQ